MDPNMPELILILPCSFKPAFAYIYEEEKEEDIKRTSGWHLTLFILIILDVLCYFKGPSLTMSLQWYHSSMEPSMEIQISFGRCQCPDMHDQEGV
jgi:hypothetical protein